MPSVVEGWGWDKFFCFFDGKMYLCIAEYYAEKIVFY
jgi:hypothetical protein